MDAYLDTYKTMKFLMGLNESHMQDPFPTINKAYSLVLHHKKQSKVTIRENHAQLDATVSTVKNLR